MSIDYDLSTYLLISAVAFLPHPSGLDHARMCEAVVARVLLPVLRALDFLSSIHIMHRGKSPLEIVGLTLSSKNVALMKIVDGMSE